MSPALCATSRRTTTADSVIGWYPPLRFAAAWLISVIPVSVSTEIPYDMASM
jgi:hypothetical protein